MNKRLNIELFRRLLLTIIILQFLGYNLWGLDPHKRVDGYLSDQWRMVDGIPSDTILSITQTRDGYLWIGTSRGLVRFDGTVFTMLRFDAREEVYAQSIRHLRVDSAGLLWIGTALGLTRYDSSKHRFKTFSAKDGITGDGVRRILDDSKGNIWISFTSSYLNRFRNQRFTAFNQSHGLMGKKINAMVEDRQGDLLFASRESGIFTYRDDTFSQFHVSGLTNKPESGLTNNHLIAMHEDRDGNLWIGTSNGLFRVNHLKGKRIDKYSTGDGLTKNYITCINEDREGTLWIGTLKGLNRVNKKSNGAVGFESLLTSFAINCLFEDGEKSLWVGTDKSGLKRLKDGKFTTYAPFGNHPESNVCSLYLDGRGDILMGTQNGKLLRCRDGEVVDWTTIPGLAGTGIAAISEGIRGELWLGTTGKGVIQKRNDVFSRFTTRDGLADNLVTSIFQDKESNLWFSTFDGVSVRRADTSIIETFNADHGLSGQVVHNIVEDRSRRIWIAADKGITVLRNGGTSRENISYYLPGVSVNCIYEDLETGNVENPVFWIATNGAGFKRLRLHDGYVTSYTARQGMASNFIYQFLEDSRGNFWLMSNNGILRVSKSELNRVAAGSISEVNCISYGTSAGMKSLEFDNEYSTNSALKTANGEFMFITKKGISRVDPQNIKLNKTPPPVVMETVKFDGRPVKLYPDAEPYTVKGVEEISFHFTAPTFLSPGKTKFNYRLDGDGQDWILLPPGAERAAYYKGLSPGTYLFRVTACNADGVWNQSGVAVAFTIKPFIYQTLMFKLAVLLLFIFLAVLVFLYVKKKRPFALHAGGKRIKYKATQLNPHFAKECITKLNYLMEVEKVYCDAEITLQSLANRMSIAAYQLSQLLNEELNRNFADFINWHRIEEAKKVLRTPRGARSKVSTVAIDVGFNTMAAFYKVFKKYTGTTPTEYKRHNGNTGN